jgi:flagellar basal-body rod protein FlgG
MIARIWMAKSYHYGLQRRMQLIANNVANSMTPGFKSKQIQFEATFPPDFERLLKAYEAPGDRHYLWEQKAVFPEYMSAIRISQIYRDFSPGAIEVTNKPLDIAIENGTGLFQFRMTNGHYGYSRAVNLSMDSEGYLGDPNGHPLEPAVKIPVMARDIVINDKGQVFATIGEDIEPRQIGQILLTHFSQPAELNDAGQNIYLQTPLAGEPTLMEPGRENIGTIRQGSLELANVDLIDAMFDMLLCQRSFEVSCGTMDEMEAMIKFAGEFK